MVVACLALTIALSGVGYAAVALPRNSVGAAQLKAGAVTAPKIKNNAVTAAKIKTDVVTGTHVNESTLGQVPSAVNAQSSTSADKLDNLDSSDFLRSNGKAADAETLDGVDSAGFLRNNGKAADAEMLDGVDSDGFVRGTGKAYVGRVVVPTSNPFPNEVVLEVPSFATVRTLNCQSGGANVSLGNFQQTRGTFTMWRDTGDADPGWFSSPGALSWGSNFQVTERTTWHISIGTGAAAEAATIDVYTRVEGSNCVFSATAQVWGR